MTSANLLHDLVHIATARDGSRPALTRGAQTLSYTELDAQCRACAAGLRELGLARAERVGIYLEKRAEFVAAAFGTTAAGGTFVPLNPLLKGEQVGHILRDCNVRVLITSAERLAVLQPVLASCHDLRQVVLVGNPAELPAVEGASVHRWSEVCQAAARSGHRVIDTDMAAILYTSGSTGRPKGVVLSHRNLVTGARSVAQYLENHADDTLLAALPLSFDAGFSQLTTAFHTGARAVLIDYLLPRDVLNAVVRERVTGLTAVPPLWIQLAGLDWPETVAEHLRYIANTGGRMPFETLKTLRSKLPGTRPFLMYGLTEAFRATYLPPDEIDRRPDSIGKAIPNAEVLVLREDGSECAPNEPGELVQRGALVGMGYWNDAEKTAERYKPLPAGIGGHETGLMIPEVAVFSGDSVRRDEDGFLYFIGRRDEMMKTSGYRVSPTEVEEILYGSGRVGECVAFGLPHPALGHAICVIATPAPGTQLDTTALLADCRKRMPAYMVPAHIEVRDGPLPRNPNGKIDRKQLAAEYQESKEDSQ
ncbi:acyl-CoA ligase (AMP-forming), exosortase A system-associated [Aromatoleum diolicum]|uniref:Acyl-CoA ligase (AMP-forming), exosortase A system-associated n=1 Tax=Aromatoleum diolicum TaxID=75796 RepID=A0ABX1QD71_9RHOO|nr:acyl-CoA ligase (AMP-forming), exosortase A system-associated [Aromatoleum diolicum]NMG76358.1 acyl-CoA ligase (AMP-forming), exosortase A system-associated [Aromatoleum diolicum]